MKLQDFGVNRFNNLATLFLKINKNKDRDGIIKDILSEIQEKSELDLGAYSNIENFSTDLTRKIFGDNEDSALPDIQKYKSNILEIINTTITQCYTYAPIKGAVNIFILPMSDMEASTDLDGINAFALGKHAMYILINPAILNWQTSLVYTLAHEYAHLVSAMNFEWKTINAGIVFEGLAEHFREFLFGGEPAKYSLALTKEKALEALAALPQSDGECLITDENYYFYISYFFGTKDLPNWYGYSLGYWLIGNILENHTIPLSDLFKISPQEILKLRQ